MKKELWQQVEQLFHAALERAPEDRSNFLDQACRNAELRQQVEILLSKDAQAGSLLEKPVFSAPPDGTDTHSSPVGRQYGPYRVLSPLGAGGMGEVYRAHDSKLGRDVAVKVLPRAFAGNSERMERLGREARVLASLNHPNIASIYSLEESGSERALVMELLHGSTLAQRIAAGPIPVGDILAIARQIGEAVASAHERGIIHRDLKPANIMITESGLVKVLDFGLARLAASEDATADTSTFSRTEAGAVLGTSGYMSPEQLRGLPLDYRTDLFSFGVVLYEMATGQRAFSGSSPLAVADAILHDPPRDFGDSPAPAKLKSVIRKLLEKEPANRYGSAAEVIKELKALEVSLEPVRPSRIAWIAAGSLVVLAGILSVGLWRGSSRERWALQTAAPEITRLIDAGEYVKAAALTRKARAVLPKDLSLEKLWIRATGEASLISVPSDAEVTIRPYRGDPNAWEALGRTPLQKIRLPQDAYVWRIVKPGFAPLFFIGQFLGPSPPGFPGSTGFNLTNLRSPDINMMLKLHAIDTVPSGMVVVTGGVAVLGYPLQSASAQVDDFLIDRHEVTNEEYKIFVDSGGYRRRDFWKQRFVKDGRTLSWEEAIALFHDATGRPGPSTWEVGEYPKGRGGHPVAGVSWYEAAAYAEFAGKSLPTGFHWMRASQSTLYTPLITSGSNFGDEGVRQVGDRDALSGFGTTDMAGNVKEWCFNETWEGRRLILGGSFGEPKYMFNYADAQSPWERRPNFGFRCAKLDNPSAASVAHIEVAIRDIRKEAPVPDDIFKAYAGLYSYDKVELNTQVEETVSMASCRLEKVTFDAAYGRERVTAYLFLPKAASPPVQAVLYFPGVLAFMTDKLDRSNVEESRGFLMQSGRALIFPIYKGAYERRDGFIPGTGPPAARRDHWVAWAKDLGRTLDFLQTREDIDSSKVAYFGDSLGAMLGSVLPAVEKRIRTAILSSGGFNLTLGNPPEANGINFVTHMTIPVLMLGGRYDPFYPLQSSQIPFFNLLGTPANNKKHVIYEDGHGAFPRPEAVRECLDWLDKYLGPVK